MKKMRFSVTLFAAFMTVMALIACPTDGDDLETYSISYDGLEGASNSNPESYTIETNDINLVPPGSREGYTFDKWYTDTEKTTAASNPVTTKGTTTGNKTFYAGWIAGQATPVNPTAAHQPDLMKKFGIKTGDYALGDITAANVTATFNSVSAFIKNQSASNVNPADGIGTGQTNGNIKLGDYVDLGSLSVAEYNGNSGGVNITANTALAGHGTLLRLIVVGINPYYNKNGNGTNTPHLVFQFQNLPGTARMNATDNTSGGYSAVDMKTYLTGNYWTGLQVAGVPDSVVWNPKRKVGVHGGAQDLSDKLWLPTEWELFGTTTNAHSAESNYGRLTYYSSNDARIKYNSGNSAYMWWEGSAGASVNFCSVTSTGVAYNSTGASSTNVGCAPAFCVK